MFSCLNDKRLFEVNNENHFFASTLPAVPTRNAQSYVNRLEFSRAVWDNRMVSFCDHLSFIPEEKKGSPLAH